MKILIKSLALASLLGAVTSCIEEVQPTQVITEEQLNSSSKATEALLWAMPSFLNDYRTVSGSSTPGYVFGYGAMMHIRDVMTSDMAVISSGYDWFSSWEQDQYIGDGYLTTQFIWNYYTQLVLTANNLIGAIDPETANAAQLAYLGMAYGYRAMTYLDMARMYEFLPNDKTTAGEGVLYCTVPITTEETTEEIARNNPRAPRQEMFNFILGDLTKAEEYLKGFSRPAKTVPDLSVIYGLMARLYMWVEDYPSAASYAQQAINTFGPSNVMSQTEWLSTTNGFNVLGASSWMLGGQQVKEDDVVQSGIINWTSWMSNETTYGYTFADGGGGFLMIASWMYDRMSDDDFRKLAFMAPAGSKLAGKEPVINAAFAEQYFKPYFSLKFRPGDGNMDDYQVGSATAYPLMRLEEMYFILAEAQAHTSAAQGKQTLEDFMKTYRYSSYTCAATTQDDIIEEIVFQKRVELWGEGQSFFDIKRLNYNVTRSYPGTNFYDGCNFNTIGRPAWMNICIVQTEANNNAAVRGYNNPDPSDLYTPGEYYYE